MKRMKLRVELIDEGDEPEIIVRCYARDAKVQLLERAMESLLDTDAEMVLTLGDTEYYVPKRDILFFETMDNKVAAHTCDKMYYTSHRLLELETIMPTGFVRASKKLYHQRPCRQRDHAQSDGCQPRFLPRDG